MATPRKSAAFAPPRPKRKPKHKLGGALLADDAEKLDELRIAEEETSKAAKAAKEAREDFERYVLDRMLFERMPTVPSTNRTFYELHQPKAIIENKAAFIEWAREHDPDLLKEEPEPREGDLNTLVKRCLADKTDLPPGVGYWIKSKVGYRSNGS